MKFEKTIELLKEIPEIYKKLWKGIFKGIAFSIVLIPAMIIVPLFVFIVELFNIEGVLKNG